jgi:thiamine pyrophosphokinase
MMRLIRICVDYDGNNNLVLNGGAGGAVDTALNNLYAALAPADAAALRQLQDDGLDEASAINKAAGHELVLPS